MESIIKELYEVAQEFVSNPEECSKEQYENALTVIELIEDGKNEEASNVGLIF